MDQKVFSLIEPVTNYIDSGKFFRQPMQWLYYIIAAGCAIFPFYVMYEMIDNRIFKYADGKQIFVIVLVWLVLTAVLFGCSLLWINRGKKLSSILAPDTKFVAVPALANFIQTSGEFYGFFIGVFGFIASLLFIVFDIHMYLPGINMSTSLLGAFCLLIAGYVIVIVARYIAELVLSIADIANNTDKIAKRG